MVRRCMATLLSRGSVPLVETLSSNERRSGRGRRTLWRYRWLRPPAPSVARHTGRSKERARTPASLGSVRARDPQRGDAPLAAPVGAPRAGGRGDSGADQEPVGWTAPSVDLRGRGSRPVSGPRPTGSLPAGRRFRALSLSSRYASMFPLVLIVEFLSVTNLRLFDSSQGLAGLGISPPPM